MVVNMTVQGIRTTLAHAGLNARSFMCLCTGMLMSRCPCVGVGVGVGGCA